MAGALVVGACLSATLQVLFDRLASREVVNFFLARKRDDKLLKKLELALRTINVVLEDAEEKEFTNLAVKGWLDELKDAVYQADDFLDEIATEAMRSKFEANDSPSGTNRVRDFDEEINQIIEKLEHFAKQKDVLGLKIVQRMPLKRLPTTSLVDESAVYGRDDDREKIVKLLLCDDVASNEIRVIPIVGMGGIGKTTLAQLAYNDRRVDEQFRTKAWVCVSEEFDVFRVTKTILAAVDPSASDVSDLNLLQIKLKEKLRGKKFLIVLDDVWNDNYENWEKLSSPFQDGAQGSKIIVTTRNESVALIMRTVPTHPLELLSDLNCWFLLAKHAFVNGGPSAHPKLESIGKEIAKKCKGLPLAAKTLGGLLRSKLDIKDWENILNSSIWDLPQDKSNVLPVLRLSYHYLPSNLKRCFAYCSTFPKDCEFEKEELVLLWIALGFVPKQTKGNKEMEQEGDSYFCELLSRSFFQQSSANKSCFVIHDLVHDLAQLISGEFCFRLENDKPYNVSEKVRHFSYFVRKSDMVEKLKDEAKYLRTFIKYKFSPYFHMVGRLDNRVLHNMFSSLRCLRVLSLSRYQIFELPDSIGNLTHLRYLDLSVTGIRVLPDSVITLWNLQTLNLSGCENLVKLPVEMWKLVNLRHLYTRGTRLIEMPMQISRIVGIQHLSTFLVGKDTGRRINELGKLCHLRGELSIQELQNVTNGADALGAKLKDKKHLANLELTWSGETNDPQNERYVLDKLQPHESLKNLTICKYGGKEFPDWLGQHSFSSLVSLCLRNCKYCLFLPPLGQLPSLKDLTVECLKGITRVGAEFYGNASLIKPFQSLEILRFHDMKNWEEWRILGIGEFSCLLQLYIIECPKLTVHFPYHISCLERLQIIRCEKLVGSLSDGQMTFLSNQVGLLEQHISRLRVLKISGISMLQEFPSLCRLKNLEVLEIYECPSLESFPNTGLLTALKKLIIDGCRKLEFPLSVEMQQCHTSLEDLTIKDSCDSLKALSLGFPKLRSLTILACTNFESLSIPKEIQNLASLCISGCPNMVSFPRGGLPAPNLTRISILDCTNLKSLTEGMPLQLPFLEIVECPELESFPTEGLPSSLLHLSILNCEKLTNRRMEFPDDMLLLPSSLTILDISFPNLKSLNHKALQRLTSLQEMCISDCPSLQSLPEGLPTSLSRLKIWKCPLLKPRCERENGEDWSKISRIPYINNNGEIIYGATR